MTKKEINNLTDKQLDGKIKSLSNIIGGENTGKFIHSRYFWTGLWEVVKILIKLFKEKRKRAK